MAELDDANITNAGTSIWTPKVIFLMADYGHDPTETAVPYTAFKNSNYEIHFATESGKKPECDKKMLQGITQKLLGAKKQVVAQYERMAKSQEMSQPLAWSAPGFSLDSYDLVFFPGGHDKGVRQIIDSDLVHSMMLDYFPQTRKPSKKAVAAICHGVMVLANSKDAEGRSVIRECLTTSLTAPMENAAYWGTRAFLGDYYKTYGHGSENVEESVIKVLGHPAQFKTSMNPGPFVVEDEKYNYLSGRYPGDAESLAEEVIKLMESYNKIV